MGKSNSAVATKTEDCPDQRVEARQTMVLRVGLLECEGKSSYCVLRNVSANGVQVKPFIPVRAGTDVSLRVGDEDNVDGRVVWVRGELAGIAFNKPLDPATLLRVRQSAPAARRRAYPRAPASGFAILRTGGRQYSATLCDISASGAKIVTAKPVEAGRTAVLLLPDLPPLRGFVRWSQGRDTGLIFETPIPIQVITDWLIANPQPTIGSADRCAVLSPPPTAEGRARPARSKR